MVVLLSIQVIGRFVFRNPPDWTEELARVAFVYVTFFGGALAVRRGAHLGIDVFAEMLPPRVATTIELAWRAIACVLLGLIIWYGYWLVERLSSQPLTSVPLSKGWMFAGVPAGCGLMLIYEFGRISTDIRDLKTGDRHDRPGSRIDALSSEDGERIE